MGSGGNGKMLVTGYRLPVLRLASSGELLRSVAIAVSHSLLQRLSASFISWHTLCREILQRTKKRIFENMTKIGVIFIHSYWIAIVVLAVVIFLI